MGKLHQDGEKDGEQETCKGGTKKKKNLDV